MTEELETRIDKIIRRYGNDPQHALAAMQDMQDELGYVPRETLQQMAPYFNQSVGGLFALLTFYKALSLKPKGRHVVKICAGTTCHIRGGESIGDGITRQLGIQPGDTTEDGSYSFEEVHCVGACALAPVVIVDDELYGHVTLEKLPKIFAKYDAEDTGDGASTAGAATGPAGAVQSAAGSEIGAGVGTAAGSASALAASAASATEEVAR